MKKSYGWIILIIILAVLGFVVEQMRPEPPQVDIPQHTDTQRTDTQGNTLPDITPKEDEKQEKKAPYYIEGVTVDEVITYFEEVCMESEYTPSGTGNPALVQRWEAPIYYYFSGAPTEKDKAIVREMALQINDIEGFPGFFESKNGSGAVEIRFCGVEEMLNFLGGDFTEANYGGFRFWYTDDVIDRGIICCRNDVVSQQERKSVIKEEIYGLLGASQDTVLREDSILYEYSNMNYDLSEMDVLILRLLYHPQIRCGMNIDECAEVFRRIYHP